MVEANGPEAASPMAVESVADQTLSFFDSVFNVVPQAYRQVDKTDLAIDEKAARLSKSSAKNGKKQAQMSIIEINERAAEKMLEIQRANALKSQQKIKQLAAEHKKTKAMPVDPDTIMDNDSEGEESKQERPKGKSPRRNSKGKGRGKGKNGSRAPLEKKEKVPSKNTVVASKMANKRQQKEAIKKNKIKRGKGTNKAEGDSKMEDAG